MRNKSLLMGSVIAGIGILLTIDFVRHVEARSLIPAESSPQSVVPADQVDPENATTQPDPRAKMRGELSKVLDEAEPDEWVPITIVMKEQASRDPIDQASRIADKKVRRQEVIRILKEVSARTQGELLEQLREGQAQGKVGPAIHALWIHNVVGTMVTRDVAYRIAARSDVAYLNWDQPLGKEVFPVEPPPDRQESDGASAAVECGVALMGAPQVWNLGITGSGVVVAVIDTGCCITHPDLANQIWTNPGEIPGNGIDDDGNGFIDDIHGWSFDFNGSSPDISDTNGHGTHVSGTVAGDGAGGTQTGMAPDCQVMVTKFYNSFAGEQSVWNCMQYAVDNGADVTTASLGWPHSTNPDRVTWRMTCENTIAAGLVVLYAAGNEGCFNPPDNVRTPGDVPSVLTIGATDCNDVIAGFSSCGPVTWQGIPPYNDCPYPPGCLKPTVCAPGVATISCENSPCTGYTTLSGTSMATPHVAGAAALILQANPNLDHAAVVQLLEDTAVDLGTPGPDNTHGAGRVDVFAAVQAALVPEGACCIDGQCEVTTKEKCEEQGGKYLGDDTTCLGDADRNGIDDACEASCVKGFSKDLCRGELARGNWRRTTCQGSDARTWVTMTGSRVSLSLSVNDNTDVCGNTGLTTCDEARGVNGTMVADVNLDLRMNRNCPARGRWSGDFRIVNSFGGVVAAGSIEGTLGVGTHRKEDCDSNMKCGDNCERCYAATAPTFEPGTWTIHTEGLLTGRIYLGENAGCELTASMQGYFLAPSGNDGLPAPTDQGEWKFCGTSDGVLQCACP